MSPPHYSALSCCSMLNFDKRRWVVNIRRTFEQELDDDNEIPVSIFNVPKTLLSIAPESYTPQLLSLGPYHCSRRELHENMDGYKLSAAKATQKKFQSHLRFQDLVEQFMKLEPKIRGCYNRYLNFNDETLSWLMAIDASFLLEFLQISAFGKTENIPVVSSRLRHLFDYSKSTSCYHAILRDMVMLENQIPLCVLQKALEFQSLSLEADADDMLFSMLMGTCKELSPFKTGSAGLARPKLSECAHLLDFLYQILVPKMEEFVIEIDELDVADETETAHDNEEASSVDASYMTRFLKEAWKLLSKSHIGPMNFVKKVLGSAPVLVIFKFPWIILGDLLRSATTEQQSNANFSESESENSVGQHPLSVEEIRIPSVAQLSRSGVRFVPKNGSISTIDFDKKTRTFYLPRISLDVNSEVVLRNLVAYETSNASGGPMVLTRFTELMNGIIDSEEDARLLREKGIILNGLKNDEEVANMWNGMSKSIRLTKVPIFIDKVIEDVNMDYDGQLKVKAGKFMKQYMFCSWKLLTLLAAVLLLILTSLQAFCSVYNCSRTFHIDSTKLLD